MVVCLQFRNSISNDFTFFFHFIKQDRPLSKSLQRGEDPQFDQVFNTFHASYKKKRLIIL